MKINKLLLALLFLATFSNAQEFKLSKVTVAELEEKLHPIDTAATAAFLFKKGSVKYQVIDKRIFNTVTEVEVRIKIYKNEGFNLANQFINYYIGIGRSNVYIKFKEAKTYNLNNNQIEVTNLKDEGKFVNNINKYWTVKAFTMPNVKIGSIMDIKYTIDQQGVGTPMHWDFQTQVPVDYCEFTTCIPEFFIFSKNQKGSYFPKVKTEKVLERADFSELKTTYITKNLPAIKKESYVDNVQNYSSSISHELAAVNFPGRYYKSFSSGWESVSKELYKIDDFKSDLNKNSFFKTDLDSILKNTTIRDERISSILKFIKSKVKWNNQLGFTSTAGTRNAYETNVGSIADINLLLIAMLRYAEIDANPVLISTRDNGIVFFPSLVSFNAVIAAVEIENDLILLDASDENSGLNVLPIRDLNRFGRLVREDGNSSVEVNLTPKVKSTCIFTLTASLTGDGSINGKVRRQYNKHFALKYRTDNNDLSSEIYLEKLEKNLNDIEIFDYNLDNQLEISKPIVETFSFKDQKGVEIINNKIYISPLFFLSTKENPFKQDVREYPVDFSFPQETKYNLSIEIPEGYEIETIPKATALTTLEGIANYKYIISQTNDKIQISITTSINTPIVPADFYDVLKEYFQKTIDKEQEQIVLVKNKI